MVLANESSKSHFSNDVSVYYVMEILVNTWFLLDSIVCFCGVPIRVKIEDAFQRAVTTNAVLARRFGISSQMSVL